MQLSEGYGQNLLMIKDISEAYVRLQENTQFLTNIQRYVKNRKRVPFKPEQHLYEFKSMFNLIVQMSYLLYSCYQSKETIFLSKQLYVVTQKDSNLYETIQDYLLKREFDEMNQGERAFITENFDLVDTVKYEASYANYVLQRLRIYFTYLQKLNKMSSDPKKNSNEKMKTLMNMVQIVGRYIQPRKQIMKPQILIRCLEETEMFQTYGVLLKTLNCSLYESMSKKEKLAFILKEVGERENFLTNKYDHTIRQDIFKYEIIEEQLERFFRFLLMTKVINIEVSYNSNSSSMKDSSKGTNQLGFTEKKDKNEERKTTWKIKVPQKKTQELNEDGIEKIQKGEKINDEINETKKQNQFIIEYVAQRELITVKYISQIEILLENMDALMFHCNNMMFQWNNASVEEVQITPSSKSAQNTKVVKRVLAFKVVSHFNIKDDPLRNIMLLIDLAMIYGKVAEPQLKKNVVKIEDQSRFIEVGKKINHLNKLFIKKIRRVYHKYVQKAFNDDDEQ